MGGQGNLSASRPVARISMFLATFGHWKGDIMTRLIGRHHGRRAALVLAVFGAASSLFAAGGKEAAPAAVRPAPANPLIRLATTTSTENSGLLSFMLPEFEKESGYTVHVVAVGTGAALKLGENADADIVLVHARALEDAFMAAGHGAERRDVMYNDFVLVGPQTDPAGLGKAANAEAAFHRLLTAGAVFVSRGDNSGTHVMEKSFWEKLGGVPKADWYKEAGQGMEQVIIMANGLRGYTLADRATWLAVKDKTSLKIVFEGDVALFNPYGIISVNPAKHPALNAEGAKALLEWFTSARGQALVASFRIGGEQLFFPNSK